MSQFVQPGKITGSGTANPRGTRQAEKAAETFEQGALLILDAGGFATESGVISDATPLILGFAQEFGHNLTTDGVAEELNYGSVVNQPSAVLIPVGAPPSDGNVGVWIANDATLFRGNARLADTFVAADIGKIFGITENASGVWEVNRSITTAGTGAVVTLVEIIDAATANGLVLFRVNKTNQLFGQ